MAGSGSHVSGGRPVRPQRNDCEREMCEVEEDGGEVFGHKAAESNQDDKDQVGAAEEEGLMPKIKKVTTKPTAEEVEQHMATHIPFRDWCPHCVAGTSKIDPHLKGNKTEEQCPR